MPEQPARQHNDDGEPGEYHNRSNQRTVQRKYGERNDEATLRRTQDPVGEWLRTGVRNCSRTCLGDVSGCGPPRPARAAWPCAAGRASPIDAAAMNAPSVGRMNECTASQTESPRGSCRMSGNDHRHTPDEERRIREAALDETIAESFPASDPPSSLPNPDEHDAIGSGAEGASAADVRDNQEASRFEIVTDAGVAYLEYVRKPDSMVFVHTAVPQALRGRGLAHVLAAAGLDTARREGLRIVAQCPFVRKYLQGRAR
jgi:predicted GNAT family acetyltransferase